MPQPNAQLGTLNRLRASIQFSQNQSLNVTPQYLGKAGITCVPISDSSVLIGTMTGGVTSPEPYQMYEVTLHLVKTLGLATAYKTAIETLCNVGDLVVKSDASNQPDYQLFNATITGGTNPAFNGTDPEFVVRLHAIYYTNSSLFDAT